MKLVLANEEIIEISSFLETSTSKVGPGQFVSGKQFVIDISENLTFSQIETLFTPENLTSMQLITYNNQVTYTNSVQDIRVDINVRTEEYSVLRNVLIVIEDHT